jgi:hypothetical protein
VIKGWREQYVFVLVFFEHRYTISGVPDQSRMFQELGVRRGWIRTSRSFDINQLIEMAHRCRNRLWVTMVRSRKDCYGEEDEKLWMSIPEFAMGSIYGFR